AADDRPAAHRRAVEPRPRTARSAAVSGRDRRAFPGVALSRGVARRESADPRGPRAGAPLARRRRFRAVARPRVAALRSLGELTEQAALSGDGGVVGRRTDERVSAVRLELPRLRVVREIELEVRDQPGLEA